MKVNLKDIQQARQRLQGVLHETQTDLSSSASQLIGSDVFFKYENTQLTGSFKIRGAFNKISSLTDEEKKRGVVASSAGNHAQGVALSARLLGTKSTIVMPTGASLNKIAATRSYGADVVLHGNFYDEAYAKAREIE
ncbi:MAG TPA: pyridoxal-phosphate dependent enzyme, partial [Pseudobdellovibrionaceae bacterium]|nr:pyridoxal-phosphate dependent enzyme [Pseudobdellovibrionaceae bacterium]